MRVEGTLEADKSALLAGRWAGKPQLLFVLVDPGLPAYKVDPFLRFLVASSVKVVVPRWRV